MKKFVQIKLTLLIGPAGSGKTQTLTESFEQALKESANPLEDDLIFLLPTAEHRSRIIDLILRRGLPGFFQKRITTFDQALKEFVKLGSYQFASDVSRRIMLKEILSRRQFRYFSDIPETGGLLDLFGKFIIELKEFLITPEELKRKFQLVAERFPEFKMKYEDLVQLYEVYQKELEARHLVDGRDSLKFLEAAIVRGEINPPKMKKVWIDGFSDFSKLQLAFIEFLSRHSEEVTVSLTMDTEGKRPGLFQIISETQASLEDLGFKVQNVESTNFRTKKETLKHLERFIFSESPKSLSSDSSIQIFEATGLLGEIEMIAREIKRLTRLHRYHFSDIAVILRQTNPYLNVIRSVFDQFQIPLEIHERFHLKTSALSRTLSSFFRILRLGWKYEDLFNFLKSSYVKKDLKSVCQLELKSRQKGIFKERPFWLEHFDLDLLKKIADFEDSFRALKSVSEFNRLTRQVIHVFGMFDFPGTFDEKTLTDRAVAKRILLLLDELEAKAADRIVSFDGLCDEFLMLLDVDLFSIHSRDKNKVQLYNVSLARQKEYKVVFLAGLLEKQFPMQVREDPILSDVERRALNQKGEILKECLPRQAFERYLFYLAVTRASEYLILSYPHFDLEGRQALPSFYVGEIKRLFKNGVFVKTQKISDVLPVWDEIASITEAEALVVRDLWKIPEGEKNTKINRLVFGFYNFLIKDPGFKSLIVRTFEKIGRGVTDSRIHSFFVPKNNAWSPTLIEEYAECSYRFFSHRLLNLEPQTEGIDIKRRGTILHDVLESFFTWQRDNRQGKASFKEAYEYCMKKFDEFWQVCPLTGDRFYKIELEKMNMREMIRQLLYTELVDQTPPISGLEPTYFEYEFKDLILNINGAEILLRGKIDRIDVSQDKKFALVIDYKTGKPFSLRALENGTSLQLPLYLIAIENKLGLRPLGGHLYSLRDVKSKGFHHKDNLEKAGVSTKKWNQYSENAFNRLIDRSLQYVGRFTAEILQGKVSVRPRDCVPYCPYGTVCRIEKWRLKHIYREIGEEDAYNIKKKGI